MAEPAGIYHSSRTIQGGSLQEFITAAAPCKSLSVSLEQDSLLPEELDVEEEVPMNISCMADVAHSLVSLDFGCYELTCLTALTCLTRLSELGLEGYMAFDEPWVALAGLTCLTGLSKLSLNFTSHGDPSPLSALTRLRSMSVARLFDALEPDHPFTFSSLQPLSTMPQLERLDLDYCCAATSLERLYGLSSLRHLSIRGSDELCSLEGLSMTSLTSLELATVRELKSMAGIHPAVRLQHLSLGGWGASHP